MEILSDINAQKLLAQVAHKGPAPDYDWDKLFSKLDHWILLKSEHDFSCTPKSMRNQLYREGVKRGVDLKVHVVTEQVYLQLEPTKIKRSSILYRDKATL